MKRRQQVNPLQDLMLTRLAELGTPGHPMSIRHATERAGGLVSYEILRRIARGEHSGRISDSTAEGLARALDVPVKVVYEAAMVPRPMTRWQFPARFDRLDQAQRKIVEDVAAGLLESYEKGIRDAR